MTTLLLQCLVAVLTLAFGVMALAVARRAGGAPELHRAAWVLTGTVFTILGINSAIHNCIAAPWAYFAGKGSPELELYMQFSPAGNHSRGFLMLAFGAMMIGIVSVSRLAGRHVGAFAVVVGVASMIVGGVVGLREGNLVRATHYTATAVTDAAELILLLVALFVGIVWNTTDRLLWGALVIFTVHEMLDVPWFSAMAWADVPGAWRPSARFIHLYASVAYLLMIVVTERRLRLARKEVPVPGLFEFPQRAVGSMLG